MKDFQYITNAHPSYIENLYNDFVKNPEAVDADLTGRAGCLALPFC